MPMREETEQGLRLIEQRRPQEAYQIFDEMVQREPNHGVGYYGLARVANLLGDFSSALKLHTFAAEVSPDLACSIRDTGAHDHQQRLYNPPYEEETTDCPVCGASSCSPVSVVNLSTSRDLYGMLNPIRVWARCQDCGHIYANPRPTERILANLHEVFESEQKASEDFTKDIERFFNDYNASTQKSYILQTIARRSPPDGDFLEIGFGTCLSMALAREFGWRTFGLDISTKAVEWATTLGFEVQKGYFQAYDFGERQFDVIYAEEVLEHQAYPLTFLEKAYRLLKPHGVLFLCTPNSDSLFFRMRMDPEAAWWYAMNHIGYFNRNTLYRSLRQVGFTKFEYEVSWKWKGSMHVYAEKK